MRIANPALLIGVGLLLCLGIAAVAGPALTPFQPSDDFVGLPLHPLMSHPPAWTNPMGTTIHAQDVYTEWVYSARYTLQIVFAAGLGSIALALLAGLTAGYFGGHIDDALTYVINLFLIVPPLPAIFVLLMGSTSPPIVPRIILLLALATWAPGARIIRSQMLTMRSQDFVLASVTLGESKVRIIAAEILPNLLNLILYLLVGTMLLTMVTEFNLEFLGVTGGGIGSDTGWGNLLWNASYDGEFIAGDWWVWGFPAIGIALSVASLVLINVGLDRLWRSDNH